jgi:hypothetical protein
MSVAIFLSPETPLRITDRSLVFNGDRIISYCRLSLISYASLRWLKAENGHKEIHSAITAKNKILFIQLLILFPFMKANIKTNDMFVWRVVYN